MNLSGAVVASGHFVVDSYVQVGVAAEDELRRIYLSRLSQAPFNNSPFTGERTVLFFCEAAVRINQPGVREQMKLIHRNILLVFLLISPVLCAS